MTSAKFSGFLTSGQPNTILVRLRPKFLAEICFGFGFSALFSFRDFAETPFQPKEAVMAEMTVSAKRNCLVNQ